MALAGPQGAVRYPIRAPNEHSRRTEIMEKSLALFFYCYQSVVHLQSSLSLSLHSPQLSVFFSPSRSVSFLPSIRPPLPLLSVLPSVLFSHLCGAGVWFVERKRRGGGGLALSIKAPLLSAPVFLLCSIREPIQPIVLAVISEHASQKRCHQSQRNRSRIMKITAGFGPSFFSPVPRTEAASFFSFFSLHICSFNVASVPGLVMR